MIIIKAITPKIAAGITSVFELSTSFRIGRPLVRKNIGTELFPTPTLFTA